MAFTLSTHFLLFLWFSGVNQFVHPSTETGSGLEPLDPDDPLVLPVQYRQYTPPLGGGFPPAHVDPIQDEPVLMRRQYRLEDFLWTGSGDGPHPSEQDGGLAWEDNGGSFHLGDLSSSLGNPKNYIRVTKTMTLYRTVLTTIYPVEMTPIVTLSASDNLPISPTPTPSLPPSREGEPEESASYDSNVMWIPTPTFSPTGPPMATARFPEPPSEVTSAPLPEEDPTPPSAALEQVYWIETSIKANSTAFHDEPRVFQRRLQKGLARVYATAFKRHLLSSLGVLQGQRRRRRKKRYLSPEEDATLPHLRWMYVEMSPTQLKQLATAAMNVTVSILNVTTHPPPTDRLDLRYVVLAEGSPVPAFSAVRELDLVTQKEMEETIGYELWEKKKALALVQGPPPEQMTRNEGGSRVASSSPWLVVAISCICLLVILLALIGFMVWKWKHNRLADTHTLQAPHARPQSGTKTHHLHHHHHHHQSRRHLHSSGETQERIDDEEGQINPAFLGTPPKRTTRDETLDPSPKSSPAPRQTLSGSARAVARSATQRLSEVLTRGVGGGTTTTKVVKAGPLEGEASPGEAGRQRKHADWNSPSSSEELRGARRVAPPRATSSEGSAADWKELLGEPKPRLVGGKRRSPTRAGGKLSTATTAGGAGGGGGQSKEKEVVRRRRKKTARVTTEDPIKTDFEGGEEDDEEEEEEEETPPPSTSRVGLGNLDIFKDSAVAQTPSEYARKLVPWKRPGSSGGGGGGGAGATAGAGETTPYFLPRGDSPKSHRLVGRIEEAPSIEQADREISEESESPPPTGVSADTREKGVQTPTRISKTASHKQRMGAKPRKSWKGAAGQGGAEGGEILSTESEEIVEVHHVRGAGDQGGEENPLGRMRKRFHQFLDDAFNVMGGASGGGGDTGGGGAGRRSDDVLFASSSQAPPFSAPGGGVPRQRGSGGRAGETQSAKVSICHEVVETETEWRPWTSHVIREETLQKLRRGRPKSAMVPAQVVGPPKRAWTASTQREAHGAQPPPRDEGAMKEDAEAEEMEESMMKRQHPQQPSTSSVILSPAFIFPKYPTYPDIRVGGDEESQQQQGASEGETTPRGNTAGEQDPAAPLIRSIKEEIRKFEREPPKK